MSNSFVKKSLYFVIKSETPLIMRMTLFIFVFIQTFFSCSNNCFEYLMKLKALFTLNLNAHIFICENLNDNSFVRCSVDKLLLSFIKYALSLMFKIIFYKNQINITIFTWNPFKKRNVSCKHKFKFNTKKEFLHFLLFVNKPDNLVKKYLIIALHNINKNSNLNLI